MGRSRYKIYESTHPHFFAKTNYIHHNPVKRGFIDETKHWRYSSARDYEGIDGLIEVEKFW